MNGFMADRYLSNTTGVRNSPFDSFGQLNSPWQIKDVDHNCCKIAKERLDELCGLSIGWDGYVAPPVSFIKASFALNVLSKVATAETPEPQIVPGVKGDLQMEWHLPRGEVELHVRAPNEVTAWRSVDGSPEGEEVELKNNFKVVAEWLAELVG